MSDSLAELGELATTAGGKVIGDGRQKTESLNPATFIGKGKAAEFADFCRRQNVDTVIFDDDLSPAQSRNLEKIFNCKVLDRTSLILDIFAQRARTREGKLQIELAQLQHLLPRLTKYWGHLSRQKGGIGMRGGEGETQPPPGAGSHRENFPRTGMGAATARHSAHRTPAQQLAAGLHCRLHERGQVHIAQRPHRRGRPGEGHFVRHARPHDAPAAIANEPECVAY
jgi:hypothetical protein